MLSNCSVWLFFNMSFPLFSSCVNFFHELFDLMSRYCCMLLFISPHTHFSFEAQTVFYGKMVTLVILERKSKNTSYHKEDGKLTYSQFSFWFSEEWLSFESLGRIKRSYRPEDLLKRENWKQKGYKDYGKKNTLTLSFVSRGLFFHHNTISLARFVAKGLGKKKNQRCVTNLLFNLRLAILL